MNSTGNPGVMEPGAVKVNVPPEVPKGDPVAALLEIRRLARKLMDEPEKWNGNAVLTRIFGLTVDGTDGVPPARKPQEWTDPEKEPRFQPGEET